MEKDEIIVKLAKLETTVDKLEQTVDKLSETVIDSHKDLHDVKTQLTQWRGIVAGVALTVSLFWGVGIALWNYLKG